ncbi:MAG TPA: multicopper oxidase domain-containing protein [Actinomycetota bacterium]|nr:multicopper oxidase domain-containing protein [Actinomycetota bacterium]
MRRFVVGAIALEVALLIVGLTWIGPLSRARSAEGPNEPRAAASYRTYGRGSGEVVEVRLDAVETVQEIAPGVRYHAWTFGGTAPGPVIRVREGDTVRFTITNRSSLSLSHSIDFHAAQTPWDVNYQPVPPGETLTFDWVARFPGVFMYHCGVPPVLHHIANGMYGAIIVEPEEGLAPAREYVLVSSEFYPGEEPVRGVFEGDPARMEAVDPAYVVFNGGANRYVDAPLVARPHEPIRLWVMNAGPTLTNAFHVIGAVFDHVYPDGNPTNRLNGIQTWNVPPGGGAMFELRIPDPGKYPFVTHSFAYTGLGAVGMIEVSPDAPPAPTSYPTMASPFDGGLTPAPGTAEVAGGSAAAPSPAPAEEPAGGTGEAVELHAAITGFLPPSLHVPGPEVRIALVNDDPMPHDFTIDELGVKVAVDPGATAAVRFRADPGTYTFYCSIPGHREAGMEGTLVVGAAH